MFKKFIAIGLLLFLSGCSDFIEVDKCLDHGGSWDYEINKCDKGESKIENISEDKNLYTNKELGFSLEYPKNYTLTKKNRFGIFIEIYPNEKNPDGVFQENLFLITNDVADHKNKIDLDQYVDLNIKKIKKVSKKINIISSEETTLNGYPAQKIVLTGTGENGDLKWMQKYTIINNRGYIFTYDARPDKYDNYLEEFEKIIDSFNISK